MLRRYTPRNDGPSRQRSFQARVVSNSSINREHLVLTFAPPEGAIAPLPGQFYMVEVGKGIDPILKRPFCFFRQTAEGVQLLYRVRGRGTALLERACAGDLVDVLGPLGNPYPMPPKGASPLVVAGGVALASVFPLIEKLRGTAAVIYGARTSEELLMLDDLRAICKSLHLTTEDGSAGTHGTVMDVLGDMPLGEDPALYICGPKGMTRAVAEFAAGKGIRNAYVSLEEFMACGVGACMGCAVKTRKGYKRVCKEGPVFRAEELVLA